MYKKIECTPTQKSLSLSLFQIFFYVHSMSMYLKFIAYSFFKICRFSLRLKDHRKGSKIIKKGSIVHAPSAVDTHTLACWWKRCRQRLVFVYKLSHIPLQLFLFSCPFWKDHAVQTNIVSAHAHTHSYIRFMMGTKQKRNPSFVLCLCIRTLGLWWTQSKKRNPSFVICWLFITIITLLR